MLVQVDDLAVSHLEVSVEANVNLDSASPTATDHVHRRHHIVASPIERLLDIHAVLVPGIKPAVPDPHGTIEAVGGGVVVLKGHPFDLRVRELTEGVGVVVERLNPPPHDLHIRLRHRPAIIPRPVAAYAAACQPCQPWALSTFASI